MPSLPTVWQHCRENRFEGPGAPEYRRNRNTLRCTNSSHICLTALSTASARMPRESRIPHIRLLVKAGCFQLMKDSKRVRQLATSPKDSWHSNLEISEMSFPLRDCHICIRMLDQRSVSRERRDRISSTLRPLRDSTESVDRPMVISGQSTARGLTFVRRMHIPC